MRRLIVILSAFVFASVLVSFAALSVDAQTSSQQYTTEDTTQESTTAAPEETSDGSEPYHQVVDNAMAGRFAAPGWQVGPANDNTFGEDYAYADPSDDAGPASFTVDIPRTDHYAVFARWPGGEDNTTSARFGIDTVSGTSWDEIDQLADAGLWVMIGVYEMEQGQRVLQISRGSSGDGRVVADAVMVVGDALVLPDGRTASSANPDELARGETAGDGTLSARSLGTRASGRDVVRVARRHLGTPYKAGGLNVCRAFRTEDCSCHTRLVYKKFNKKLPDSPVRQWRMRLGNRIAKSQIRLGDLVFHDLNKDGDLNDDFRDHVSIYAGNGKIIHASSWCNDVCITEMRFLDRYWGAKRIGNG